MLAVMMRDSSQQGEWEVRTGQTCVNGREGGQDASRVHHGYTAVSIFQHRTRNREHRNRSGTGTTPWVTFTVSHPRWGPGRVGEGRDASVGGLTHLWGR